MFGFSADASFHPRFYAFITLGWLLAAVATVLAVRRSRLGRALLAMRTNERAAESLGISVTRAKLSAFIISSAIAGCAGVLLAFQYPVVTFGTFGYSDSINIVVLVVVAGIGSITGGLLSGVLVISGLVFTLTANLHIGFLNNNYATITGLALVITVLRHPNGMSWRDKMRRDDIAMADETIPSRIGAQLDVRDISVFFGGVRSLAGVDLAVRPGSIVGLVGPNGAGKSTLLDAISGFAPLHGGSVSLNGESLDGLGAFRRARRGVGRVFQGSELFEDMTVALNLRIAAEQAGSKDGRLPEACTVAIERFGLRADLERLPGELSLANRKFVSVARALAGNPSVLLMDEPAAGLSMTDVRALGGELRALAKDLGIALVLVEHDMELVMSACDEVVVLRLGSVLAHGRPEDIQASEAVRSAFLGSSPAAIGTVTRVTDTSGDTPVVPANTTGGRA
jgi:sulfate-transporting ATPase